MQLVQVLNPLLAAYLLIIGIMTLRNSRRALRLHWVFVWLKIPLAEVSGIGAVWTFRVVFGSAQEPPPAFSVVMGTVMALIYPVGLIFALPISRCGRGCIRSDSRTAN